MLGERLGSSCSLTAKWGKRDDLKVELLSKKEPELKELVKLKDLRIKIPASPYLKKMRKCLEQTTKQVAVWPSDKETSVGLSHGLDEPSQPQLGAEKEPCQPGTARWNQETEKTG